MTDTEQIRLVIIDDQAMLRGALAALLELEDDLTVVGVAGDGDEAVQLVSQTAPDVCLMDIQMPGMDGIAATEAVCAASPETRVLIVTTFARPGLPACRIGCRSERLRREGCPGGAARRRRAPSARQGSGSWTRLSPRRVCSTARIR